jgi:hypothetical protein
MNSFFGNFKFLVGKMVHIPKWEFRDVTEAHLALFIFALLEFLVPASHAIESNDASKAE